MPRPRLSASALTFRMSIRQMLRQTRKGPMLPRDRSPFLPDDEILRRLRMIRYSSRHERQARRATSLRSIAAAADMNIRHLYDLLTGKQRLTDWSRQRLNIVLRSE